jgi:hypothetical protein
MEKADRTIRELGQLYEFYREIKKARLRKSASPNKAVEAARDSAVRSLSSASHRDPRR